MTILTIGHSTRLFERFLAMLQRENVALVIDVRRYPVSRRHPHYSKDRLRPALASGHVDYAHIPALGGHREPPDDSPNSALRNGAFRGYADHMATAEFKEGLAQVVRHASLRRTVLLCAEADPGRCHRSLLADALVLRGIPVLHILEEESRSHVPHRNARLADDTIIYQHQPASPQIKMFG